MKVIDTLVIHCSDSLWGDRTVIDSWHKDKGFKEIGYHYVILNGHSKYNSSYNPVTDGLIQPGRSLDNDTWIEESEVGAHALGFNQNSIGVCLVGGANGRLEGFTETQYHSALLLVSFWSRIIPKLKVMGHNETGANKACPVIDMNKFRTRVGRCIIDPSYTTLKDSLREGGF